MEGWTLRYAATPETVNTLLEYSVPKLLSLVYLSEDPNYCPALARWRAGEWGNHQTMPRSVERPQNVQLTPSINTRRGISACHFIQGIQRFRTGPLRFLK